MTLGEIDTSSKDDGSQSLTKEKVESIISDYLLLGETPDKTSANEFVQRLKNTVKFIGSLQSLRNLYRMNNKIENDVKGDLKEMEFLVNEMEAVLTNITRLRNNRIDIHKELNFMKGALEAKNKEEIQEIETVIAIYDKELLKKWHVAKKTSSAHSLENFINNVAGKKQAIEHVYKLALDKLATLKKTKIDSGIEAFHLRFGEPTVTTRNTDDTDTDSDGQFSLC